MVPFDCRKATDVQNRPSYRTYRYATDGRFSVGAVGVDKCRPALRGADMYRPGLSGPRVARRGTPPAARLCRYQICSSGIFRCFSESPSADQSGLYVNFC
jgi:hypothetical protein